MHYNGEAEFLGQQMKAARLPYTVFDVGANRGMWSREVVRLNPQVTLHGFEPDSSAYQALCSIQWPETFRFINSAVGGERANRAFHVFGSASVHNSLYPNAEHPLESIREVAVETLDDYCGGNGIERIDYLKIDVEGNELEVLRGATGLLGSDRIGLIQLEYGDKWIDARCLLKDLYDLASPYGLRLFKLVPRGKLLAMPGHYDYGLEDFRHSTVILRN